MLEVSHNPLLVIASLAVALMAGFTGLSLTRGASGLPVGRRKGVVAMASVALGGGIWSMHFVAMLGLQLPVPFFYDALITLISALVAILITGCALLVLHFGPRTPLRIGVAGAILGSGITVMHYTGMSGMEMCQPVYSTGGIALAFVASIGLSILALRLAYDARLPRNFLLGTLGFGVAVFSMHFVAMAGTDFIVTPGLPEFAGRLISNEVLAFGVVLAAFAISGGFLLTGATFAEQEESGALHSAVQAAPAVAPIPLVDLPEPDPEPEPSAPKPDVDLPRVPFEKDSRTQFIDASDIAAIRAEGHYTLIYAGEERLFCPWSIAQAEERLTHAGFLRTHRSYLVNGAHVSAFERKKDTGILYFDGVPALEKAPVARARLAEVRDRFGL